MEADLLDVGQALGEPLIHRLREPGSDDLVQHCNAAGIDDADEQARRQGDLRCMGDLGRDAAA